MLLFVLFSSNPSLPVLCPSAPSASVLPKACCWEMFGCAALAQLHVTQCVWGLYAATIHCCGCIQVDMQLGMVDIQGWPVPQGASSPSGPSKEGSQDSLFPAAALHLHPSPHPLLLSLYFFSNFQARQPHGPGGLLGIAGLNNGGHRLSYSGVVLSTHPPS
jgi:hypothetical protein